MKALVLMLNIIYPVIKLIVKQERLVVFLSRQDNVPTLDFRLITDYLSKEEVNYEVLCNKLELKPLAILSYLAVVLKQMILCARAKVVVVDSYIIPISVLKHRPNLKIIQMWHASGAIKQFGYQTLDKEDGSKTSTALSMKMHRNYDYILAASEATKEIFALAFDYGLDKFFDCGLPRLDFLEKPHYEEIRNIYHQFGINKKTVLYAPTFRKGKSLLFCRELIEKFNYEEFDLVIKLHPLDKTDFVVEQAILDKEIDTLFWLSICDVFISDYSALIFDAAYANKMVYLYTPDYDSYSESCGLNIDITGYFKDYIFFTAEELVNKLSENYESKKLNSFSKSYMPTKDSNQTAKLGELIISLLEK